MPFMEGALWKWTNYMSGWQLRWFVLDVGVLSYYKSEDEIKLGSRGSVKIGCCDVSTLAHDPLRIDLKIPPDQHMYVKASTAGERQQWLVALGTSKACLTQGNATVEKPKKHDPMETLHEKMSEVHTCKDILVEQINNIKKLCKTKEEIHEFQEAATLLSATCGTFLNDLNDCIIMAEQNLSCSSPRSSLPSTPRQSGFKSLSSPRSHNALNSLQTKNSPRSSPHSPTSPTASHSSSNSNSPVVDMPPKNGAPDLRSDPDMLPAPSSPNENEMALNSEHNTEFKQKTRAPTVFSMCPNRFIHVHIAEDDSIPTKPFLLACNSILPIFDVLGPTAFAPVKLDISGNIKKLTARYDSDKNSFSTIQLMINHEIQSNTCSVKNSATDALLWLKRALQFTNAFLEEINKGERELVVVASTAYSKTLRKYHGWVVRGIFAMAVKAVPYWKDFAKALGTTDTGVAPESDVLLDIKDFTSILGNLIANIDEFYAIHNLDSDNTV